jgi:hypothetical protein
MEGVQTIARTLAAAKSAAHEALAAVFGACIESNDKAHDETDLAECEATGVTETDASAEIVQAEEIPVVDAPDLTAGLEAADSGTVNDESTASEEIPAADTPDLTAGPEVADSDTVNGELTASEEIPASNDTSSAAEQISGDQGPAPEGGTLDAAN